jgi:dihydrodipicolinate synthase/N-acetylneuraminate lyase
MTRFTPHLYIFGTAGEGYAVTDRQFAEITRVFCREMQANGAQAMVGVINLSLGTIVERIAMARELGVRLFQISLPAWGALSESELFTFFREVCGRFEDCRFVHYNLPRTKRLVTPEGYARLAIAHENLVGTKNTGDSMDRLYHLMTRVGALTHFPSELGYTYASGLGECGLLSSVANLNPQACHELFEAGRSGNRAALLALQAEITELTRELVSLVGESAHMDGAYDKLLWRLRDGRFPLNLLPPYAGATEEACNAFAEVVRTRFPRWQPPEWNKPAGDRS